MELIVLSLSGSLAAVLIQLLEFIDNRELTADGILLHRCSLNFRYQSTPCSTQTKSRHIRGAETLLNSHRLSLRFRTGRHAAGAPTPYV